MEKAQHWAECRNGTSFGTDHSLSPGLYLPSLNSSSKQPRGQLGWDSSLCRCSLLLWLWEQEETWLPALQAPQAVVGKRKAAREEGTIAMCTCSRCLETRLLGKALLLPSFSVIAMVIADALAVPKELHRWKPSASMASSSTGSTMHCKWARLWRENSWGSPPLPHRMAQMWSLISFSPPHCFQLIFVVFFYLTSAGFANIGCLKLRLLEWGRPARRSVPIEAATRRSQKRKWGQSQQSPWTLELEASQCHQVLQRGGKAKKKTKVSWGGKRATTSRHQNIAASFSWLCCAKGQRWGR